MEYVSMVMVYVMLALFAIMAIETKNKTKKIISYCMLPLAIFFSCFDAYYRLLSNAKEPEIELSEKPKLKLLDAKNCITTLSITCANSNYAYNIKPKALHFYRENGILKYTHRNSSIPEIDVLNRNITIPLEFNCVTGIIADTSYLCYSFQFKNTSTKSQPTLFLIYSIINNKIKKIKKGKEYEEIMESYNQTDILPTDM